MLKEASFRSGRIQRYYKEGKEGAHFPPHAGQRRGHGGAAYPRKEHRYFRRRGLSRGCKKTGRTTTDGCVRGCAASTGKGSFERIDIGEGGRKGVRLHSFHRKRFVSVIHGVLCPA